MIKWLVIIILILFLAGGGYFAYTYLYNSQKQDSTMNTANTQTNTDAAGSSQLAENEADVTPISHATFIYRLGGQVIYNDPVGGAEAFQGQPAPNIILLSDIHGDHLDVPTLIAISTKDTIIVAPKAVIDNFTEKVSGSIVELANGEKTTQKGIEIEAVPMYNLPASADSRHTKGRGNGYILSADGKRVYIAGDTSVTPEMKALKNIDVAFVPMNLPFTMGVEEAAQGVLAFKPKRVHPYHYRGQDGLADVDKFKDLVNKGDPNIEVALLNFYPHQ